MVIILHSSKIEVLIFALATFSAFGCIFSLKRALIFKSVLMDLCSIFASIENLNADITNFRNCDLSNYLRYCALQFSNATEKSG